MLFSFSQIDKFLKNWPFKMLFKSNIYSKFGGLKLKKVLYEVIKAEHRVRLGKTPTWGKKPISCIRYIVVRMLQILPSCDSVHCE